MIIHKIAECSRLAAEYSALPVNAESPEAYEPIRVRKALLKERIDKLKAEIYAYEEGDVD